MREKPIPSSARKLRKDYGHKGSVEEKNLAVILQGLGAKTNRQS
jgi:hypothetical protein